MKKVLLCALLSVAVICCGTALYAQQEGMGQAGGGGPHQMSPDQWLQNLTQMLNLSTDQQQKIKPILENEAQQMQALRQDSSVSQEDKMSKMREVRQTTMSQIKPILNADQQKKFEEMRNHHMPPGAARGEQGQGAPSQAPPQ